jgi:hypothetical protein
MKRLNLKNYIIFQFPWQFLMLAIFIQSSIGSLKLPDIEFDLADKFLHFFAFGILGILTARGLRNAKNRILKENYTSLTFLMGHWMKPISILYLDDIPHGGIGSQIFWVF